MRLNKFLAACGVCSRREADRLIAEGCVSVNGGAAEPGQLVNESDDVRVKGQSLRLSRPRLLAFYKPRGVVCTESKKDRAPRIKDVLHAEERLVPVGRLDKDSEGLLLLTNQGGLAEAINKSRNGHEKEYLVRVRHPLTDRFLAQLAAGVEIRLPARDAAGREKYAKPVEKLGNATGERVQRAAGGDASAAEKSRGQAGAFSRAQAADAAKAEAEIKVRTRPCKVQRVDAVCFSIILTEGMNRQIRRMCSALGNEVTELKRVRVMNICLGALKPGDCREVTEEEQAELLSLLARSAATAEVENGSPAGFEDRCRQGRRK